MKHSLSLEFGHIFDNLNQTLGTNLLQDVITKLRVALITFVFNYQKFISLALFGCFFF